MTKPIYKCLEENCKDNNREYRFRGLCRSCTEYVQGEPVVPILRVKHNANGTLYQAQSRTSMGGKAITRQQMQAQAHNESAYRKHKTMMRKMRQARRLNPEEFVMPNEPVEHDCCATDTCEHKVDLSNIGESVGEEE